MSNEKRAVLQPRLGTQSRHVRCLHLASIADAFDFRPASTVRDCIRGASTPWLSTDRPPSTLTLGALGACAFGAIDAHRKSLALSAIACHPPRASQREKTLSPEGSPEADLMVGSSGITHFFLRLTEDVNRVALPLLLDPVAKRTRAVS